MFYNFFKRFDKYAIYIINKIINRIFYEEINSIWIYGDDDLVVRKISEKYPNIYMWESLNEEVWLIYLTCLVNTEQYETFDSVFKTYMGKFSNSKKIENYLPISEYLFKKNNENYKISSNICDFINKNRKDLYNIINNAKSIAIVGNASTQLGKGLGKNIDNHDLVIRFNNFQLDGFESDYGGKTDIWVRGAASNDVKIPKNMDDIKFVVFSVDYYHFKVHYNDLSYLHEMMLNNTKITSLDIGCHKSLKKESGIIFPTTGLLFIWYVYCIKKSFDDISIFGFGFQSNVISKYNEHYFEKRDLKDAKSRAIFHDMFMEAKFLKKY